MKERKRNTPLTPVVITTEQCTIDMKQQIIAHLPFLHGLSEQQLSTVVPIFREIGFEAGEQIDTATNGGLFVVGAGLIKLVRSDYDGRDVVLDLLVTGEVFGSMVGFTELDRAVAHTACCLFHVSDGTLKTLFRQFPDIAVHLLEMTSMRITLLHERLHLLTGATARARVIATLVRLADKVGTDTPDGVLLQVPFSREELASLSGTTPETASRIISSLQRDKHLKTGRRWITLATRFFELPGLD